MEINIAKLIEPMIVKLTDKKRLELTPIGEKTYIWIVEMSFIIDRLYEGPKVGFTSVQITSDIELLKFTWMHKDDPKYYDTFLSKGRECLYYCNVLYSILKKRQCEFPELYQKLKSIHPLS